MATDVETLIRPGGGSDANRELADQWRRLRRAATAVALMTSPAAFVWFHRQAGLSVGWAILAALGIVVGFRGAIDLGLRRLIPWPTLFGTDDQRLREDDVVARRRAWFWHRRFQLVVWILGIVTVVWLFELLKNGAASWTGIFGTIFHGLGTILSTPGFWVQVVVVFFLFFANFAIFMGPLLIMGISQIRGYEPGDAQWGVKLDDVRGQAEAKEEVRRVVSLWQSGEAFESAGGKRERGLMFLGAPGTGKTMLAKAIATGFNSPFVSIPGSGFAATFIGIDAIIVRYLARKAKRLAAKWGGTCIVFIDEIDAVGMRRNALAGGATSSDAPRIEDHLFFGPWGAFSASGDLVVESRAWRERLFAARAPRPVSPYPGWFHRLGAIVEQAFPGGMFGGMMGGQLALNQLLVTMDGIDNPPFMRRVLTNRTNTLLDASYIVPRRIGRFSLRLPPPKPRGDQIFFIGATNVPMENLDPALTRPGRMGRHVWFRTPTKEDRKDIFDLYLAKVAHDAELDTPNARDELARMTSGYSPAMIDQVCSMALTHAQHDMRPQFSREDIIEAMTTIESGTAVGIDYVPVETRATAVHEAGHAACAHVYVTGRESTRLSIKMRGSSLGHHQAMEKEERFSAFRSEDMADLTWTLGALAAEHVFYGENTRGVGGDLHSATTLAALMVGQWGMSPPPLPISHGFDDETEEQTRERVAKRLQTIGKQIMNSTQGGDMMHPSPVASVLRSADQRDAAAQLLGHAFVTAYNLVRTNKEAVDRIATTLAERRELHGDDVVRLLDSVGLRAPELDLANEDQWPKL